MQIEAHLAQQPVASTILRPSAFVDILKRAAGQIAAGSWAGAAGEGRVNFIDTRDVADVARVALLEEFSSESQRAYHLTGPRPGPCGRLPNTCRPCSVSRSPTTI